jgi:hypothetical protein
VTPWKTVTTEDIPCRFGCAGAVGIFWVPQGCVCWPDPVQALCQQHAIRAQSTGPIVLIAELPRHGD